MQDETTPGDGEASEQAPKAPDGNNIRVPLGIYKIYSSLSYPNWLVDMSLSGGKQERNVKLYRDNNEPESTWDIYNEGNDYKYTIANVKELTLLLTRSTLDSAVAYNWGPATISPKYRWSFRDAGNGFVYIVSSEGFVLDVKQSNTSNNTDIIIWGYAGTANQKFKLVKIRDA